MLAASGIVMGWAATSTTSRGAVTSENRSSSKRSKVGNHMGQWYDREEWDDHEGPDESSQR
ncbi:hypothetical protein SARC_06037 [Sphaeroforma arctica JP610]|uniref:Uncharacterized protein n=1 Tax=Sphaeroforma arctica JP610 TaxID=667725 RepID=A0A0L0FXU5_9EUKA|nr:hypothetical protein SARC_06037 [Sphaeroforma arctica JP610]KNC81650.1 hypothetical protein SARC_06037 [Sphaeroforma arctica JP610]|eukprot:XP_014155552.1 hypothetical protein SARC_06037 [Sphaeroforma arctica JP610]